MRRRYVILLLAFAVALAAAVPAIGGNGVFGLANHALKVGKKARAKAKKARQAGRETNHALSQTNQTLNSTKIVADEVSGQVDTDSATYVSLGGPSVNVTVGGSGLIQVWAQADIEDNADGGSVALFEDGQIVPGQAPPCDPDISPSNLFLWEGTGSGGPVTVGTPASFTGNGGCGTLGAPGPVQFKRPPGNHTYELRYADPCPCGSSQFTNRVLRVGPQL